MPKKEQHPNSLKNLEKGSFKKGVASNPKGMAKGTIQLRTRIKRILEDPESLPKYAQDKIKEIGGEDANMAQAILIAQGLLACSNDVSGSTKAAEFVMERGYGKEPDKLDVNNDNLDDEDREILERYWQQKNKDK